MCLLRYNKGKRTRISEKRKDKSLAECHTGLGLDHIALDSGNISLRFSGFSFAEDHIARQRRSLMDSGSLRAHLHKKISKIWILRTVRTAARRAGRKCDIEELGCQIKTVLAGYRRRAADLQSDRLFFSVRSYAVLDNRRNNSDQDKPEIWLGSHPGRRSDCTFTAVPFCAFPERCRGRSGSWRSDRSACVLGRQSDFRTRDKTQKGRRIEKRCKMQSILQRFF